VLFVQPLTGEIPGPIVDVAFVTLIESSNKNRPFDVPVLAESNPVGM